MRFAGLYVNDDDVFALAVKLRGEGLDDAATRLADAYTRCVREFPLTYADCESILQVLEDDDDQLTELGAALRAERASLQEAVAA